MGDDAGGTSVDGLEVVQVPEASRYEARLDGRSVGVAEYLLSGDRVVFPHTVVDPALTGRGIASELARRALDDARERGLRVVPACSFFRVYLQRHPEDADLIA
ncbi:MAG TPA: GNAT family N-acetyltransferase [Actinomycetales bacterium]|nr:GNAT family N-acetyltransferase [Actinomycetales bacterium]